MPNKLSTKKAVRSSAKKRQHNLFWKERIKFAKKELTTLLSEKGVSLDILNPKVNLLQKLLDKASKEQVIHKNKANRLKSRYAKKVSALVSGSTNSAEPTKEKSKSTRKSAK